MLALRAGGMICPAIKEEGGLLVVYPAEDLRGGYIGPELCMVGTHCPFPGEAGLLGGLLAVSRRESWVASS